MAANDTEPTAGVDAETLALVKEKFGDRVRSELSRADEYEKAGDWSACLNKLRVVCEAVLAARADQIYDSPEAKPELEKLLSDQNLKKDLGDAILHLFKGFQTHLNAGSHWQPSVSLPRRGFRRLRIGQAREQVSAVVAGNWSRMRAVPMHPVAV